ncbi:MAG: GNAT family N-acetyltransferase [Anaerolineae bacterium]|nr:GNAT family N-acetyltransferase [Anaerolineae bacterium]
MQLHQRDFSGEADKQAMIALARACRTGALHGVDLPYRLSSWALDEPSNVALWFNFENHLVAWVVLQAPFWMIDYVCRPDVEETLHRQIVAWADKRAYAIVGMPHGHPSWFVSVFADQATRILDLEEAGFVSQADMAVDAWSKVLMRRPASMPVESCLLPTGFVIRPLAGAGEVEAYVALHRDVFLTKNMTPEWRARVLRCPEYTPDLDLVAVAPDGRLAAFCVGWLDKTDAANIAGQIEPLGVHADFRSLGLGRAILSECLRRLHRYGVEGVYVETDKYCNAALGVYEAVGFRTIRDVLVYGKDYDENGD